MFKLISLITTVQDKIFADIIFINNSKVELMLNDIAVDSSQLALLNQFANQDLNSDIYQFILKTFNNNAQIKSDLENSLKAVSDDIDSMNTNSYYSVDTFELQLILDKLVKINSQYHLKDNSLYFNNIKLPQLLVYYFKENINNSKYINSLHLFWLNVLNKENYSNIEDLFLFIHNNGLTITPNGYLFVFRRVRNKQLNNLESRLIKFVSTTWAHNTIYSLDNDNCHICYDEIDDSFYSTFELPSQFISNDSYLGTVSDNINNIKAKTVFTDNHSQTFNFKIGNTYIVDNVDNDPSHPCSYGLHAGSKDYVNDNSWLGETIVGCVVNPRDIIAVADSHSKLRCRKLHIVCIIDNIDNFKADLFNYDYELAETNDKAEFAEYKFNELYNQSQEFISKLNELNQIEADIMEQLNKYNDTIPNLDQIKNQLKNNYVTE